MDPVARWHGLLRETGELDPASCSALAARMRAGKLTFGERVHCPFLRPFFLTAADEARIRPAVETLAAAGEHVVRAAADAPPLLAALGVGEAELELIRIDPGYGTASTASRADAFLLPDAFYFAEYNAESPAGPAYTERLAELFESLAVMAEFRKRGPARFRPTIEPLLEALLASYRDWGGRASPPTVAIVDWREVPTWTEFELLGEAFVRAGVPTVVCDPRELQFARNQLTAQGRTVDLVYRRVLTGDVAARRADCGALVDACAAQAVCLANSFRCKLAHKKAFFALITDDRYAHLFPAGQLEILRRHVPWTRLLADVRADAAAGGLIEQVRREREQMVVKPNDEYGGRGVVLGWEVDEADWEAALQAALADPPGTWVVQRRIPVRREIFPRFDAEGRVTMLDMLVDFAPYLFRGRMHGFLTRLSSGGLANVTSGGGQVPSFIVG